jgi:hypothetical protein
VPVFAQLVDKINTIRGHCILQDLIVRKLEVNFFIHGSALQPVDALQAVYGVQDIIPECVQ